MSRSWTRDGRKWFAENSMSTLVQEYPIEVQFPMRVQEDNAGYNSKWISVLSHAVWQRSLSGWPDPSGKYKNKETNMIPDLVGPATNRNKLSYQTKMAVHKMSPPQPVDCRDTSVAPFGIRAWTNAGWSAEVNLNVENCKPIWFAASSWVWDVQNTHEQKPVSNVRNCHHIIVIGSNP